MSVSALKEQHVSHEQVRARLFGTSKARTPAKQQEDSIEALEKTIVGLQRKLAAANAVNRTYAGMAERLKASEDRAEKLELDLSDARARILAQAEMLRISTDGIVPDGSNKRTVEAIVRDVLRDFPGITWEDVKGVRRERYLVIPRHACMKAVYEERKDLSLPTIGRLFGGRDHTTILSAVRKVEKQAVDLR